VESVLKSKRVARAFAAACVASAAFAAVTWWSLESSGVAIVTTRSDTGERSTHVWFVEDAGRVLVEAGSPENGWYRDVQMQPVLDLEAHGLTGRYVATPLPNPAGHDRIRKLLREKYGFRDAWIALLFDTSRSLAVALEPAPAAPNGHDRSESLRRRLAGVALSSESRSDPQAR
jgi:hypothetical protein